MIIDTHAHYDDSAFDEDRDALLASLPQNGIGLVVNIGSSIETSRTTLALTEKYPHVYGALGVHPSDTAPLTETDMQWLEENLQKPKIVAVGEIGLDYHWDTPDRNVQKKWFVRQIALAKKVKKPLVIHSRDAAADTLDMMKAEQARDAGGIIHCFSYGVELAREYLNMGFYIGVGGVVTFQNTRKLKEVVAFAPLERIVLETDCPYLAPVPNRGKRNSSLNLPYVVEEIAKIKQVSATEVTQVTSANAHDVYQLVSI